MFFNWHSYIFFSFTAISPILAEKRQLDANMIICVFYTLKIVSGYIADWFVGSNSFPHTQ
jgi:hypothetical protein